MHEMRKRSEGQQVESAGVKAVLKWRPFSQAKLSYFVKHASKSSCDNVSRDTPTKINSLSWLADWADCRVRAVVMQCVEAR
jgi:hypothetical protein